MRLERDTTGFGGYDGAGGREIRQGIGGDRTGAGRDTTLEGEGDIRAGERYDEAGGRYDGAAEHTMGMGGDSTGLGEDTTRHDGAQGKYDRVGLENNTTGIGRGWKEMRRISGEIQQGLEEIRQG